MQGRIDAGYDIDKTKTRNGKYLCGICDGYYVFVKDGNIIKRTVYIHDEKWHKDTFNALKFGFFFVFFFL